MYIVKSPLRNLLPPSAGSEAEVFSETLSVNQTTRRNIPEDRNFNINRGENLKYRTVVLQCPLIRM